MILVKNLKGKWWDHIGDKISTIPWQIPLLTWKYPDKHVPHFSPVYPVLQVQFPSVSQNAPLEPVMSHSQSWEKIINI